MITTRNRFTRDNYDNRSIKLCLRTFKGDSEVYSLFSEILSSIQLDRCFEGSYTIRKRGLQTKSKTRPFSLLTEVVDLFTKDASRLLYFDVRYTEANVTEESIRLSKQIYTKKETIFGETTYFTPQDCEIRRLNVDGWNDEKIKSEILNHNKQAFEDSMSFDGICPAAVRLTFSVQPLITLYVEIDKSLLSDEVTKQVAEQWRKYLLRFAAFGENAGSYLGIDNAIMQQTAHEEYFYCDAQEKAASFPGYLWCNLLNEEQFFKIEYLIQDDNIAVIPVGKNYEVRMKSDILNTPYDDYRKMREILGVLLPTGEFCSCLEDELTNRLMVILLDEDFSVTQNVVKRHYFK